jgi:hypothetical protein
MPPPAISATLEPCDQLCLVLVEHVANRDFKSGHLTVINV